MINLDEIGDRAVYDTIEQVAHGAAQDQRQTKLGGNGTERSASAEQGGGDKDEHHRGYTNQDESAQHRVAVSEYSKRRTGIFSVDDAEPSGNHGNGFEAVHRVLNRKLRNPVAADDSGRNRQRNKPQQ